MFNNVKVTEAVFCLLSQTAILTALSRGGTILSSANTDIGTSIKGRTSVQCLLSALLYKTTYYCSM